MVKRTLSDGELFAQSKNRHELNHLKIKLEELKTREIQSSEQSRIERHKWREFLRTNSRNSGTISALMSDDSEDLDLGNPKSSRSRCDPRTVEKYQRQWVIAYHNHSHNKVYNEIEQAGASVQRSLMSPRATVSVSGSSSSNGESPSFSKHVTAVMGVKRVRNSWDGKRPKTSGADYRHMEITDLNLNKDKLNCTAPWLRKEAEGCKITQGNSTSKRNSFVDQTNQTSPNTTPQNLISDKLLQSVSSMQAVNRSRETWRCSICGKDKIPEDLGNKFAHTVLVYKGLNKILNNLQSKSTSALQENEVTREEPKEQRSTNRCSCSCRKTSSTEKSDRRLSQTSSTLTYQPIQEGHRRSPRISTSSLNSQQSRRDSRNKETVVHGTIATLEATSSVNLNANSKDTSLSSNNENTRSPPAITELTDDVVNATVDFPENEVNANKTENRNNSVLNADIEPQDIELNATYFPTSPSNVNDKSNIDFYNDDNTNQLLTSLENTDTGESGRGTETNKVESNTEIQIVLPCVPISNPNDSKFLDIECNPTKSKTLHSNDNKSTLPEHITSSSLKVESSNYNSQGQSPNLKGGNAKKAGKDTETQVSKPEQTITIDLKPGELFFQRAAQTIKAKMTERRSMGALIVSADKGHPRIRKHESLENVGQEKQSFIQPIYDPNIENTARGLDNSQETHRKVEINTEKTTNYVILLEKREKRRRNPNTVQSNQLEHRNKISFPDNISSSAREVDSTNIVKKSSVTNHKENLVQNLPETLEGSVLETQNLVTERNDSELHNHDHPRSGSSRKESIVPSSARSHSARGDLWKQAVEFKGITIKNYIPPHLRYKTAASDKLRRPLSVQWHPNGGAVVTVHEKSDKARLIDFVFPKQARQKQLLQMIEDNHRKLPSTATFIADADLRRRIDVFLKSVEPFCRR